MRLDQKVVELLPELSRASAARLIINGKVKVNDELATKASQTVAASDKVTVDYEPVSIPEINLPIIYEDDDCVVIDKPVGVLTHSKGAFNPEATVATWLRDNFGPEHDAKAPGLRVMRGAGEQRAKSNSRVGGSAAEQAGAAWWLSERAGIVHRLDRATSGVMVCAKNPVALKYLQKQFSERKAKKTYIAVIEGELDPQEAMIDLPIERNPKKPQTFRVGAGGKTALTHYKVIKTNGDHSLIELKPTTGRTHQLRVHLSYLKHPIVGDALYGGQPAERLMLHAVELEITLPGGERKVFKSKVPTEFAKLVK